MKAQTLRILEREDWAIKNAVLLSFLLLLFLICPRHPHTCWNSSRFPVSICCSQRCLLPLIQKWLLCLHMPFLHSITSPLCSSGEGDYVDHPGFFFDRLPGYVQKKSLPHCAEVIDWLEHFLCNTIKHPSSCSPLGCTVEQLHAHSVWPKLTEEKAIYWALNICLMHSQHWANVGISKGTYRDWFFLPQFGHNPDFT